MLQLRVELLGRTSRWVDNRGLKDRLRERNLDIFIWIDVAKKIRQMKRLQQFMFITDAKI